MLRKDVIAWDESNHRLRNAFTIAVALHIILFLITFPEIRSVDSPPTPIKIPPFQLDNYIPPPPPEDPPPTAAQTNSVSASAIPIPIELPEEHVLQAPILVDASEDIFPDVDEISFIFPSAPPQLPATVIRIPGINAPESIYKLQPTFPATALGLGKGGLVIAQLVIGVDGYVEEVTILRTEKGVLGRILADEVERTLAAWIYKPALEDERPVRVQMTVTVKFNLDR